MNAIRHLGLLSAALLTGSSSQVMAQARAQDPGRDITVTNSPGAITADTMNIDTMNLYEAARRDPVTQQFVATLQGYQRMMSDMARQGHDAPGYIFLLADSEGGRVSQDAEETMYMFTAGSEYVGPFGDHGDQCEVQEGIVARGLVMRVSRGSTDGRLRLRHMTRRESAMLDAICDGLGRPISWLGSSGSELDDTTVFDFLSRYSGYLSLWMMPATLFGESTDLGIAHQYWMGALQSRYINLQQASDLQSDPDAFAQMMRLAEGQEADIRLALPPGAGNPTSYPTQARTEFGARVDRLDADWRAYLARWALTVRGERRPFSQGDRPAPITTPFRRSEIGTPAFWRAANDMRTIIVQVNCIAGRFLSDREYLPPEYVPDTRQCPVQISSSRTRSARLAGG